MSPAFSVYLDLLRLSAALIVFAHHASYARFDGLWISALGGFGHEAVVIFIVLSGFVVSHVVDLKEHTASAYAASRLSRLWSIAVPAIIVTLLMDGIGRTLAKDVYDQVATNPAGSLASVFFANEFWFAQWHPGSNIPFWSLSYEAAYYLLFGLYAFTRKRWIWMATTCAIIGPKILLLAFAWAAGVVACRLASKKRSHVRNLSLALGGAAIAAGLALSKFGNLYITYRWEPWFGPIFFDSMGSAASFVSDNLIALGLALHLVGVAGLLTEKGASNKTRKWFSTAGLATFPLYLIHYPSLYFFTAVSLQLFGARVGIFIGLASLATSVAFTPLGEWLRSSLRNRLGIWLS